MSSKVTRLDYTDLGQLRLAERGMGSVTFTGDMSVDMRKPDCLPGIGRAVGMAGRFRNQIVI